MPRHKSSDNRGTTTLAVGPGAPLICSFMLIDWIRFTAALGLLLTPIALFHGKKVRYRPIVRDWDTHWQQVLTLGLHTIDAGRAMLGGWLLVEALAPDPAARGLLRYSVLFTQGGLMSAAVLLQTFFCKEPDSAHAPFAFVSGLLFGVYPPAIAGLPLLLAITVATGSRSPAAFFPMLSVALFGFGFLFGGKGMIIKLILGMCAVMLPWLCSLLFSRDLVISYRAKRPDHS
jgi:hypothetical protein